MSRLRQRHVDLLSGFVGFVLALLGLLFGETAFGLVSGAAAAALLDALGRYLVSAREERDRARAQQRALFRDGELPVPLTEAFRDGGAYRLGVDHEAREVLDQLGERARGLPYVTRDIDAPLRGWLRDALGCQGCSVVVLEGVSKAGKSRTLLAALAALQEPRAMLVRPADAGALNDLAARYPDVVVDRPSVIWLDDLEDWLADTSPLTLETVARLAAWPSPVVLAGTLGGRGLMRLRSQQGDGPQPTEPIKQFLNGLNASRSQNSHIETLEAEHSAEESQRLDAQYGLRAGTEIAKAGGIGSYMIAGPHLLERLKAAPQAQAAVVMAAIYWRFFGFVRPIPRATLNELHRLCVDPPAVADTTDALLWATERVYGSRLLRASGHADDSEAYEPLDYIISRVTFEKPRREMINYIIDITTDPADLTSVGYTLFVMDELEMAEVVWRRSDERGHAGAASSLGLLLQERNELEAAEAAYRRGDERGEAVGALNLGLLLEERNELEAAEAAYRRGDERGLAVATFNLGRMLQIRDEPKAAEAAYRRADERGHAVAASNLGVCMARRGDLEGAEAAYRRGDERGDAFAAFNLGLLLLNERDDEKDAIAAWLRAKERGLDSDLITKAFKMLVARKLGLLANRTSDASPGTKGATDESRSD